MDVTPRLDPLGPTPVPGRAAPGDGATLDVTPRAPLDGGARPRRPRNLRAWALGLVVVAALVFVLLRGLGNATLFFYNVDEAVARQHSLGDKRFRLQGTVEASSIVRTADGARFTVTYNGAEASVVHQGDLPQLFQPDIPVVLEGRWHDGVFDSDRMLVKHSEVYTARNPDRVRDYEGRSVPAAPSTTAVARP